MAKVQKVYLVTAAGEYSGYHIKGVFASKADAERAVADTTTDDARVEDWTVRTKPAPRVVIYTVAHHKDWRYHTDLTIHRETFAGLAWDWYGHGMPKPTVPFMKRLKGKTLADSVLIVYAFDKQLAEDVFRFQWERWEAEFAGVADE